TNSFADINTAIATAANAPGVNVVSMSFGAGESSDELGEDSLFIHTGVTFLASTGDFGAPGGYPAFSPNVVAVGGTTLNLDSSGNILGETGWSGSGGGGSLFEPKPDYQRALTSDPTHRIIPDVSYDSDPSTGFPVYDSFTQGSAAPWIQVGGTSDAAPQWAALIAIADQGRALAGLGSLSGRTQTLPMLYKSLPASDFHDITAGN